MQMRGRLRLDKLSKMIESFLSRSKEQENSIEEMSRSSNSRGSLDPSGLVYFHAPDSITQASSMPIEQEIQQAVTLAQMVSGSLSMHQEAGRDLPVRSAQDPVTNTHHRNTEVTQVQEKGEPSGSEVPSDSSSRRRQLVNRDAVVFGEDDGIQNQIAWPNAVDGNERFIPVIPFEELMLVETLGMGRVSSIYRAAWKRPNDDNVQPPDVSTVALKVAMVDSETHDTAHVDELRREADIAAVLDHPNVCKLIGVAVDAE